MADREVDHITGKWLGRLPIITQGTSPRFSAIRPINSPKGQSGRPGNYIPIHESLRLIQIHTESTRSLPRTRILSNIPWQKRSHCPDRSRS